MSPVQFCARARRPRCAGEPDIYCGWQLVLGVVLPPQTLQIPPDFTLVLLFIFLLLENRVSLADVD